MQTFSANEAKQNFGEVIDAALRAPVAITKHGRRSVVITSDEDYRELQQFVHAHLKAEVRKGIDDLEAGRVRTFESREELSAFFGELKDEIRAKAKQAGKSAE
jgi:prevent-host-death family protein